MADEHVLNRPLADVSAGQVAAHQDPTMMTTPYNPVVVNTGSRLVLIDTGGGEATLKSSKGMAGQLNSNLAAAGIDRNAIDTVIISHYHGDHINGLLNAEQRAGIPQCGDPGAGRRAQVLHGRRRDEPRARGPHADRVQERAARLTPDVLKRIKNLRARQGRSRPASPRSTPTATRRATIRMSSRPARTRCSCRPTSRMCRGCSCAIRAGTRSTTRTARKAEATRRARLRHAGGGQDAGAGLPLPVPRHRPCREDRQRLSRDPAAVESDDL